MQSAMTNCPYCGLWHSSLCPRISSIEHYPDGTIKRVEFHTAQSTEPVVVSPGMAWRDIACSAYRAYAASTGNKNYQGNPMPVFNDLPASIQIAWEAAVRQTGDCLRVQGEGPAPDESHWAGWTSPSFGEPKENP